MKKEYTYPRIDVAQASPEMIPLLEKTLDYLAESSEAEAEDFQHRDVFICIAIRITYFGSKGKWANSEKTPQILQDIFLLIETALSEHDTRRFDIWWLKEYGTSLPNSSQTQWHRRIWLNRIIVQLKRHFGSSTQN